MKNSMFRVYFEDTYIDSYTGSHKAAAILATAQRLSEAKSTEILRIEDLDKHETYLGKLVWEEN